MKRFAIFSLGTDGHPELYADTDLISEAESFEQLGYLVVPSDGLPLTTSAGNAA